MEVGIFWDTMPCSPYMNWRFGGPKIGRITAGQRASGWLQKYNDFRKNGLSVNYIQVIQNKILGEIRWKLNESSRSVKLDT
jgi:hypothetical protein